MTVMHHCKKLLAALAMLPSIVLASNLAPLDEAPIDGHDVVSLQRGARTFVNYCMGCHSAAYMRYNRLTDLGLSEQQIKDNLMLAGDKIGEPMTIAMKRADASKWFGAQPPDLSVVARSRGADWLYTYLRTYYRDESRPTGWNNIAYPNVGMPHVLWELQGEQVMQAVEHKEGEEHGAAHAAPKLVLERQGALNPKQYDAMVGDLVNYLVYMGEPARTTRSQLGIIVLLFLGVAFVFAYLLKKEYWKDVH